MRAAAAGLVSSIAAALSSTRSSIACCRTAGNAFICFVYAGAPAYLPACCLSACLSAQQTDRQTYREADRQTDTHETHTWLFHSLTNELSCAP